MDLQPADGLIWKVDWQQGNLHVFGNHVEIAFPLILLIIASFNPKNLLEISKRSNAGYEGTRSATRRLANLPGRLTGNTGTPIFGDYLRLHSINMLQIHKSYELKPGQKTAFRLDLPLV